MAPVGKRRPQPQTRWQVVSGVVKSLWNKYVTVGNARRLVVDPSTLWIAASLLFIAEIIVNILVIQRVPYTEIDWKAYMQEVEGAANGTWDYSKLRGDTGPLVYPAGFVYVFGLLYYMTNRGENILLAQYIFAGIYLATLGLVLRLYSRAMKVPPFVLVFLCCTSYRIHSIYVLRLFNDPVAMLLLYAALSLFIEDHWSLGSLLYSLAVSIKMNILLFAPALLVAYITCCGVAGTLKQLTICAAVQVILGVPFLLTAPVAYMKGAFDLGRVFLFEWTVNWRFLSEDVFIHPAFHVTLLAVHVALLAAFTPSWFRFLKAFGKLRTTGVGIVSQLLLLPMFSANFIGVAASRSLHYQFYVWYFHSLPYLLWSTPYSNWLRLCLLGIIELCWNVFPSTSASSLALHLCHLFILAGLWMTRKPTKDLNFPLTKKD